MKNKILIRVIATMISEEFEVIIPVNERIGKIKKLIIKNICDLMDLNIQDDSKFNLIDPDTGQVYINQLIIRDTNIKNAKRVLLV